MSTYNRGFNQHVKDTGLCAQAHPLTPRDFFCQKSCDSTTEHGHKIALANQGKISIVQTHNTQGEKAKKSTCITQAFALYTSL